MEKRRYVAPKLGTINWLTSVGTIALLAPQNEEHTLWDDRGVE